MPFSCIPRCAQILDLHFFTFPIMLSLFFAWKTKLPWSFPPFVSNRWTNFQCLRCLWSEISFCVAFMNWGFYGCCFISPYVDVSLLIIAVIRAIGWQIFLVQSTFECARWTFWRYLDAKIVAIFPLTEVVIEANAQYAVKPIYLIVE